MKIYTYHAKVKKDFDITNLIYQLISQEKINLIAIKHSYDKDIKMKLSNLNIDISYPIIPYPEHEILLSESEKILIVIQARLLSEILDIKILSENEDKFTPLLELIRNFNGIKELNYGTFLESKDVEDFNKELKLSPHGKKLKDKKYENISLKLHNHKIREILAEIIETYGGIPLPIDNIKDLEIVKKNKKIANEIFKDNTLISKSYIINCSECSFPTTLIFDTKTQVEEILKQAQYICPSCEESKPEILETFYIREEVKQYLKEGLWLEKYMDGIMREETQNVWSGVMIDTNELDTIAILNEQVFLIECKDTSFGQNDFYVLLEKARVVNANVVIIVTTREIHENVKTVITKYKKEKERKIYVIKSNITEKIRTDLQDILRKVRKIYIEESIKKIFYPLGRDIDIYRSISK